MLLLNTWLSGHDAVSVYVMTGVGLLLVNVVIAIPLAAVERRRLRLVDREPVHSPHPCLSGTGVQHWLWTRLREAATWREFSYAVAFTIVLPFIDLGVMVLVAVLLYIPVAPLAELFLDTGSLKFGLPITSVTGKILAALASVALVPPVAYLISVVAAGQAEFARMLLGPKGVELSSQVHELTRSRTRLVDAFEAERRRIERDLHDGAQQRLVTLIMTLGVAELELAAADGEGPRLVGTARREAEGVLAELRELIRGIHPQVLTDRGIVEAVMELADRCPIPVSVDITLSERLKPGIEAVAYFAVSEALANVVKHSQAERVRVAGRRDGDRLALTISDDGVGGADPTAGSGLQGLADRVAVVGGRLTLISPYGGPTHLLVELPCHALGSG
ncbi:sensor histidine kinase [Amycolatopsis samaneae]